MKTILCRIPQPTDATSFYRAIGPLSEMKKASGDITLTFVESFNFATIMMADVIFIQRPHLDLDVKLVEYAKLIGCPVWVDYDDDLFSVPTENPAYRIYANPQTQKNIAKIIHLADQVTVSTNYLKQRLSKLNDHITVVPNALNDRLLKYRDKEMKPRNKLAVWRGSPTHQKDVMQVSQEIMEVAQQETEATFEFIGDQLWFMTDSMPKERTICAEALDVIEYHKHIYEIAPAAMMVPLQKSVFNFSKSNIAWIEGTFAGAAVIAPDMNEWIKPGCLNYKTHEEFGDLLTAVLSGKIDAADQARQSWEYIQEHLLLRNVNKLRFEVLNKLLDPFRLAIV